MVPEAERGTEMSNVTDAELAEAEARKAETKARENEDERIKRKRAAVLAEFNDTVSMEGFGGEREDS